MYYPISTFKKAGWTSYEISTTALLLIGSFGPNKLIPYAAPLIILGAAIVLRRDLRALWRLLIITALFAVATAASGAVYGDDVYTSNAVLAFVTFSALYLYFLSPFSVMTPNLTPRLPSMMHWLLIVQAVIGIVQALSGALQGGGFDVANGDRVEGTIHLPLPPAHAFSNAIFSANVAFMLLFLAPYYAKKRFLASLVLGSVAFVLASVLHLIIMLIVAFSIAAITLILLRGNKKAVAYLFVIAVLFAPAPLVLHNNFQELPKIVDKFMSGGTPKAVLIQRVTTLMPVREPLFPWVGFGPGQFSSRAGLIMTGRYLGGAQQFYTPRGIGGLVPHDTRPQKEYLLDLWERTANAQYSGSTQQPFFSWLTTVTEFGLMAYIGMILLVAYWVLRINLMPSNVPGLQRLTLTTSVLLLFLTGFQENYWEVPQAIMLGIFLQKVMYFSLKGQGSVLPDNSYP